MKFTEKGPFICPLKYLQNIIEMHEILRTKLVMYSFKENSLVYVEYADMNNKTNFNTSTIILYAKCLKYISIELKKYKHS